MSSPLQVYVQKYDIRGKVSSKFGPTQAYLIGKGFAQIVKDRGVYGPSVVVGCDVRPSGPEMLDSLVAGLVDSGIKVKNISVCITPMVRFASMIYNVSGSIMVTASHNSLDENGFKFTLNGDPFYDYGLVELCQIINKNNFSHGVGSSEEISVEDMYLQNICKNLNLSNQLTTHWVARNEYMTGLLEDLLNRIPGQHLISPTLQKLKTDLTFDFDTDADRMMLYDSNFRQWHGDEIIAFYALHMKQKYPSLKVIFDLKCSRVLLEWVRAQGIACEVSRVGSCFIDNKLKKTKAHLGGEVSGHFMFVDYNNFSDDGIHSALRVMDYLSHVSGSIESYLDILPKIHVSKTIKVPCKTSKFEVIEQIRSILINDDITIHKNEEDAILVQRMEGWYIIRTSQTENIITVRCEGFKKELLESLLVNVEELFSEVGMSLW